MEYPLLSFTVGMNDFVWIFHYAKIQNLVVSYLCHYKGTYYSILYVEAKEMGFALFGIDIAEFFLFCSAPRPLFNYELRMKNDELKIIEFAFLGCYGSRWCYFLFLRKNISPESSGLYQRSSINCAAVSSSEASIRPKAFISSEAALSGAKRLLHSRRLSKHLVPGEEKR